jgi:transposase InsO family protein
LIKKQKTTKAALARQLGVSRSSLYYVSKQLPKDWALKNDIGKVMDEHPSYGSPRLGTALRVNRKRIVRVMKLFGIKAYRRRGRRLRKSGVAKQSYPNLLKQTVPSRPHHIWVADFTYIPYRDGFLFLATTMDLFTREVVGMAVQSNHAVSLVLQALFSAVEHHARPVIFHSDNGREYGSNVFTRALRELGISISRSAKSSPWENGYQESFYSQFKIDLGDPSRFKTLGELVYEVYRLIWDYNHRRIHSVLKMPPLLFAERYQKLIEKMS